MAVTFNELKNYYSANFNGKQYTYSVNKYGPLAEEIANESFKNKKNWNMVIYKNNKALTFNDYPLVYIFVNNRNRA